MKNALLFSICLLFCLSACKKDKVEEPVPAPAVQDFRDTVVGSYTGSVRYLHIIFFGADTITDTTYAYTLNVTIDTSSTSTANSLWMDGVEMDANASYAVQMNDYWQTAHPRQSASGQFTLLPANTFLSFMHSDTWQGNTDKYIFQGTK